MPKSELGHYGSAVTIFNIIHGISPAYLKEDISLQDNASHQTRSVTSLSCQTPRVNSFGLKSFFYTAIKSWNLELSVV